MQLSAMLAKPLGPLPLNTHSAFGVRVEMTFESEGSELALAKLESVLHQLDTNSLVLYLFEQAVVRTLVVNIRRRFLATMERSLEMKVLEDSGKQTTFSPRKRFRDVELKNRLQRTMDQLNEAHIAQDYDQADVLNERAKKIASRLQERLSHNTQGKPMKPHRLSAMVGHQQFRRRLVALMGFLTDAQFVQRHHEGGTLVVGVGPKYWLDKLETPSATEVLAHHPTSSKFKSFWRHVEFGTGARRSAAKDQLNSATNPPAIWEYGRSKKYGLLLEGTLPMNFLTTSSGTMYPNDITSLSQALTQTLDALLTA